MDKHKSDKHGTRTIQHIVGRKLNNKIESSDCTVKRSGDRVQG